MRILNILALVVLGTCLATLAAAEAAGGPAPVKASSLIDLVIIAGPIEYILIALSVISYSLAIKWVLVYKPEALVTPGLRDDLLRTLEGGATPEAIDEALNIASGDASIPGTVLAGALEVHELGYQAMKDSAELGLAAEQNRVMSRVNWLSMFASSATLLGLLGTVSGIIFSFLKMAAHPGGVDANVLSKEIGEALVCTGTGLAIAIGNLYLFFWLRTRVNSAIVESGYQINEILDFFRGNQSSQH